MDGSSGRSAPTRVIAVTGTQVQSLLWKLHVVLPCLPTLPLQELEDDELPEQNERGKHVLQEASIIGHLASIGALGPRTSLAIELGAGTGRLSDRLHRVTGGRLDHVLVDRQQFKPLALRDRHMRARIRHDKNAEVSVQRVVDDIAYFDFNVYSTTTDCCQLCMSKHLCGPACDLAIVALGKTPPDQRPLCCLATCCHYLCTWDNFSGRQFWLALGLDKQDFCVAVATSQWASMRRKLSKKTTVGKAIAGAQNATDTDGWLPDLSRVADAVSTKLQESVPLPPFVASDEFERTFSRHDKIVLGMKAKELLDFARAAHLQQELGYRVKLVKYTTRSLEDRLLVAAVPQP